MCLAQRNREALLRIPPLIALAGRRPGRTAAPRVPRRRRHRQPLPRARRDRACGARGRARRAAGAADPRVRPRAARRRAGRALRRRRAAGARSRSRCRRSPGTRVVRGWMTPLLYDAYTSVKRAEIAAAPGPATSRSSAGAMPRSTDELLARLLEGIERELPRRRRAAPPPARRSGARARGGADGGERRRRAARRLPDRRRHRTHRARRARRRRARRRARRARRAAAARAHRRLVRGERRGDARVRARRAHGRAGRADARRARARASALPVALLARLPAERGGLPVGRPGARARRSSASSRRRPSSPRTCTPNCRGAASRSTPAPSTPRATTFEIAVEGEPSHGAYPHRGRDPILALAQIVVALHAQLGRRIDPLQPASLTVGVLEGGQRRERDSRARVRTRRAARTPAAGPPRAARARRRGRPAPSRAPTAASASVALTPGEPALENDPAIVALARELLPRAGLTTTRGVALVRVGRLRLLRRAGAARDGVRRPRRRRRVRGTPAAPPRAAGARRRRRRRRARAGRHVRGRRAPIRLTTCPTGCTSRTLTRPTR